jgi:hypothetical protein
MRLPDNGGIFVEKLLSETIAVMEVVLRTHVNLQR